MNNKKLIVLLFAITIYINYNNYISIDTKKLSQDIAFIKTRIEKEKEFAKTEIKEIKQIEVKKLFFPSNSSFSQTMGNFQNLIERNLKNCKIKGTRWQTDTIFKKKWYSPLSIKLSAECKPTDIIKFQNALSSTKKFITYQSIRMSKKNYSNNISFVTEIRAYRLNNEK